MNNLLYISIFSIVLSCTNLLSQEKTKGEVINSNDYYLAEQYYDAFTYRKAIDYYKKVYQKDSSNTHILFRIAECHYRMRDFPDAFEWATLLVNTCDTISENLKYYMFETSIAVQNYEEAVYWYEEYLKGDTSNTFRVERMRGVLLFKDYKDYTKNYQVAPVSFNSNASDYSVAYYSDTIVFVSSRSKGGKIKGAFKNDEVDFFSLYKTVEIKEGEYDKVRLFSRKINTGYHEGPITFYDDHSKIIFSQSSVKNRGFFGDRTAESESGVVNLQMYMADYESGKVKNIVPFPYNNLEFSTGHPTVSEDGNTLIFSSNRPDGMGRSDLYLCHRVNNSWTPPVNLGDVVNTPGSELFPFFRGNVLFFASDGHEGLGELDIYKVILVNDKPQEVINLGYPVNSSADDFGYASTDGYNGFFSSNRGTKGKDNIYQFTYTDTFPANIVKLMVYDVNSKAVIRSANVELTRSNDTLGLFIQPSKLVKDTMFEYRVDTLASFNLKVYAQGYFMKDTTVSVGQDKTWRIYLNPVTVGQKVTLQNIYYDFDKSSLRDSSKLELNRLIKWMENNPETRIRLISHTDTKGSDEYNYNLSMRRAKTVFNYMVENGVDSSRLEFVGKGESEPVFPCPRPSDCSETQQQANRRTEFEVLGKLEED